MNVVHIHGLGLDFLLGKASVTCVHIGFTYHKWTTLPNSGLSVDEFVCMLAQMKVTWLQIVDNCMNTRMIKFLDSAYRVLPKKSLQEE